MKKSLKIVISLLIVVGILVPSFLISVLSERTNINLPIVYIEGYGSTIVADKNNPNSEVLWPIENLSLDYLKSKVGDLNPIFINAYLTGDYTEYCDYIYEAYAPLFERLKLDNNGEVKDNSGVYSPWRSGQGLWPENVYGLNCYLYRYDWRLGPNDIADDLHNYINDVKAYTGSDKINLISRCYGCNIACAYLDKYGTDDIGKCVFNSSGALGVEMIDRLFAGDIKVESGAAERYTYDAIIETGVINDFIKASISLAERTYMLDGVSLFIDSVYTKVMDNLVPRLLTSSFGTFPSFWAMTNRNFEKAKDLQFGDNKEEYAGLIEKIDDYHYNAQANLIENISETKGVVDYYIIAKYGYQLMPVQKDADQISDQCVIVPDASMGATVAESCTSKFSKEYVEERTELGYGKYISPDWQIDASTCVLPEKTWFIKNMEHSNFEWGMHNFIRDLISSYEVVDINTDERYPQFLEYNEEDDTILPLTDENKDVTRWNKGGLIEVFIDWCKKFKVFMDEYLIPLIKAKYATPEPVTEAPQPVEEI